MTAKTIDRRNWLAAATAVGAAFAFSPVRSVSAQAGKVAAVANYQGSDREQWLLNGAKQEGALTLYSNMPPDDNRALVAGFDKYGIKINLYRASSEDVRNRFLKESQARRFEADFIIDNAPVMEALTGEKLLLEVKSPHLADLMPAVIRQHRAWVGFCFNVLVQAYNTKLVDRAGLPKSYEDLLDPKWKGRLAIEADDSDWFAGLMELLGPEKGLKLFRDIAASNGFSVRRGHTLMTNLVSAGEVQLALTVFNYTAEQLKKKGAPIDWFVIEPLVTMPNAIAISANAPHPHAAVLFFDYMLSDAQKILADRDYGVINTTVASPLDRNTLHIMDSAKVLADGDKWQKLYTPGHQRPSMMGNAGRRRDQNRD